MKALHTLTLTQAQAGLARGDWSAVELTQAFLARMDRFRELNVWITETPEQALVQARASDERRSRGEVLPLDGLPLAIKDLYCTRSIRTTAGSRILENFVPGYESTVTRKLWEAGGVCLGKTNMDEFAMGSSNITSAFGPVVSPWRSRLSPHKKRVPGGSSGGSAAAVAAGLALAALGSDTGGSIRQPASFSGLVGLKPTYGRCSRRGMVALASSLDQAGPLTRTVEDAALLLSVIAGGDVQDGTSVLHPPTSPVPWSEAARAGSLKGLRIGLVREYEQDEGVDEDVRLAFQQTCRWFEEAGAELVPVSLPHASAALAAYYVILPAEASSNLARYDGVRFGVRAQGKQASLDTLYGQTRDEGFGAEVKRRILTGAYVLSSGYYDAYYARAWQVRRLVTQDFRDAFESVDGILTPSTPSVAFPLGEEPQDPVQMYLNDIFTVTANIAGIPGLSVPVGTNREGLPVGMQILAPHWREDTLLRAGAVIEKAAQFDLDRLCSGPTAEPAQGGM
jgi:aspartyl-tRNA(Asn)/glutamyl-tRNA(Gln) amidotransferase subunit A